AAISRARRCPPTRASGSTSAAGVAPSSRRRRVIAASTARMVRCLARRSRRATTTPAPPADWPSLEAPRLPALRRDARRRGRGDRTRFHAPPVLLGRDDEVRVARMEPGRFLRTAGPEDCLGLELPESERLLHHDVLRPVDVQAVALRLPALRQVGGS